MEKMFQKLKNINFSRYANCDVAPLKTKRHKECLLQRDAYGKGVLNRII